MARHAVAPNLLMLLLIFGGLYFATTVRQEVFPSFDQDTVTITVALPGATPEEVEEGIVLAVEEELRGIQGIDKLIATANEGAARIIAELRTDRDRQLIFNDIQQAVERITTFPEDAEEPVISLDVHRRDVVDLEIYGNVDALSLRMAAEHVRDRLLQEREISQVEIDGARDLEIHVEIASETLRALDLTPSEVAATIREAALDRAGGTLETSGGDILIRVADRRDQVAEFARIPLIVNPRETVLRLGDVADVRYGFDDTNRISWFNGTPSLRINVCRVGDETPITVSDAVKRAIPEALSTLPDAIGIQTVDDDSEIYRARMELLLKNGFIGLCLVLLLLSLFLEFRLAFWVAVGIPTAFLGTLLFLPWFDVSINMVSMFAFILALGIVVDDAIVVGENIHEYLERGMSRMEAAIQGARDIAVPISFSVLTNIIAFIPLALVPGGFGKFWLVIPLVVSTAFTLSWIEALFVLPAHLAAVRRRKAGDAPGPIARVQRACSGGLAWTVRCIYGPLLRMAINWRYATVALMVMFLTLSLAWTFSGRMGFGLFPSVPRDYARATVTMPVNTPLETRLAVADRMVSAAEQVIAENGADRLGIGVHAQIDETRIRLRAYLQPPEIRPIPTAEFTRLWREAAGEIPAVRSIRYESSFGGPGGQSGIQLRLSHPDVGVLAEASRALTERLARFAAVRDPEDGFTPGKTQLEFRLTETGRAAGLTSDDVARQVRSAFRGAEALRQQEGRNEITVRVRLPAGERRSEWDIENLILRTPDGGEIPLYEAASVERSRADAAIRRENGRRVVTVSANIEPSDQTNRVLAAATEELLPQLARDYPGLGYELAGRQATTRDTMESFRYSVALTLVIMYGLLAIPFRSYVQPLIVMAAIPFGFAGAVLGHLIMGMSLSIISVFGMIALGGVVINAALVMIDYANKARDAGATPTEAIWRAGLRRFRPIVLTTVTTFGGLAPMIFESSRQAKFLVPMEVSIGYGIVFATLIVLFLIPCLYLIVEDFRWLANPPRPEPGGDSVRPHGRPSIAAE